MEEMAREGNGKLIKWQVDETHCNIMIFLMKWEIDEMAS